MLHMSISLHIIQRASLVWILSSVVVEEERGVGLLTRQGGSSENAAGCIVGNVGSSIFVA